MCVCVCASHSVYVLINDASGILLHAISRELMNEFDVNLLLVMVSAVKRFIKRTIQKEGESKEDLSLAEAAIFTLITLNSLTLITFSPRFHC